MCFWTSVMFCMCHSASLLLSNKARRVALITSLDENLPRVVERMVEAEIERVTRER
jgi:hypothetical protein